MGNQVIFRNFSEYWYYARPLSMKQREIVFDGLSQDQKEIIEESYLSEGWVDVMCRNEIDEFLDKVKTKFGYDLLNIRSKVKKGNSVYVPKKFWDMVIKYLDQYRTESICYLMYGITSAPCKENDQIILLSYSV